MITYICIIIKPNNKMPTLLILFGIRFYFYTREHLPIHIHIKTGDGTAKFEIDKEIRIIENKGIKPKDMKLAESIIEENRENFISEWIRIHGE